MAPLSCYDDLGINIGIFPERHKGGFFLMKISRLRRALAVFLSAAMLMMCMPFTGITAAADVFTDISTESALQTAASTTGGNYRFTSSISTETLHIDQPCVFDLGGNTLNITKANATTNNIDDGLKVNAATTFKNGTININGGRTIHLIANADLTLDGITFNSAENNGAALDVQSACNVVLKNSSIICSQYGARCITSTISRTNISFEGNVTLNVLQNNPPWAMNNTMVFSNGTLNLYGDLTINSSLSAYSGTFNFYNGSIKNTQSVRTDNNMICDSYSAPTVGDGQMYYDAAKTNKMTDTDVLKTVSEVYSKYHPHSWAYRAGTGENANTLEAYCTNTDDCPLTANPKVVVSAVDTPMTYSRYAYSGASFTVDSGFPVAQSNIAIQYVGTLADGTTAYDSADKPTEAGTYKACVTIEEATAYAEFEITPKELPSSSVSVTSSTLFTYDNSEKSITLKVTSPFTGQELTLDKDYKITGTMKATAPDTYTVSVEGIGNYKTTTPIEKTWTIKPGYISARNSFPVMEDYNGQSHTVPITFSPENAAVKFGTEDGVYDLDTTPSYTNAGVYFIYYKATLENYSDNKGYTAVVIYSADVADVDPDLAKAEDNILAGEVLEDVYVDLPECPENMTFGIPVFTDPAITSAVISDGKLVISTTADVTDGTQYVITVPVTGKTLSEENINNNDYEIGEDAGYANFKDYNITVTLTGKDCEHPDVSDEWSSDEDGHWHDCPDCSKKVDYTGHTEVIDAAVSATCTEAGITEGKHCSVCGKVLVNQAEDPALGHDYDENGICTRCGEVRPSVKAAEDIDKALDSLKPTNDTTPDDVKTIVDENKGGTEAAITVFELTPATEDKEGSLKVIITVSDGENIETVIKEYVIDKLPASSENEAAKAADDIDTALDGLKPTNDTTPDDVKAIVDDNKGGTEAAVTAFELTPATEENEGSLKIIVSVSDGTNTEAVTKIFVIPALGAGNIKVETEGNVGGAVVDAVEVKNAVDITPEEQALINSGYDLHIILNVQNADKTVSDKDKALTEAVLSEDMKVGMYLDISLFKKIGDLQTAIHDTNAPITITFTVPESLINADEKVTREYFIIRVHNGVTDILNCTFDPATGKASFMTDKFSSYAIAYKDTVKKDPAPVPETAVKYPVIVSGNAVIDKPYAEAGDVVNVGTNLGYDIIVTDGSGNRIAVITEKGSFIMPASKVYISVVKNAVAEYIANGWRHSYVYSYDADMNRIKVNSDIKRGVIVINLGAEYAGKDFTIYSGRKSTKTEIISGTLDKNGRFTFKASEGKNYTLVVE